MSDRGQPWGSQVYPQGTDFPESDRGRFPSAPFNRYSGNDVPVGLANSARLKVVLSRVP